MVDDMPLPKNVSKQEKSKARLQRYHARKAAEQYWGREALLGKDVHHRNGNKDDNRRKNLRLKPKPNHGGRHGRGNKGSYKNELRYYWRQFKDLMIGKKRNRYYGKTKKR